jgi:hypothetical protein
LTADHGPASNDAIPFAIDPPIWGAGRRPGRHVKRTVTLVQALAAQAEACSARPGRRWAGWLPQPPTQRDPRTEPRPSRGRSAPAGGKEPDLRGPHPALRRGVAATPRAQIAAGRLPAHPDQVPAVLSVLRRPPVLCAVRASRWAWAWSPPSDSGSGGQAPDRRRVRPVSGRLENVQKVRMRLGEVLGVEDGTRCVD